MPKKQNIVYQTFLQVKDLHKSMKHLEKVIQDNHFIFADPFEFAKLYNKSEYKILFYYKGAYFDRNSKSELYDLIKPDITKSNFLRYTKDEDLPRYLLQYSVNVALAHQIATGDLITTLGHIISPVSYTIRHYRNSAGNYVKLVLDGEQIQIHLGETMATHFITPNPTAVVYLDGDFTNNRIENLQTL